MKKTKLTRSLLAACSIVALTAVMYGCTHSSDDPPATDDTTMMPEPTPQEQIAALQEQINALRAELGLPAIDIDDLTGSVATLTQQRDDLQKQIDDAQDAEDKAAAEAAAKDAVALFDGITETTTDLTVADIAVTDKHGGGMASFTATGLTPGVGMHDDLMKSAEPMLGMWQGTMLTRAVPEDAATNAGTSSTVVVYTDIAAPKAVPFGDVYTLDANGNLAVAAATDAAAHTGLISASAFDHTGRMVHDPDEDDTSETIRIRGMLNGAVGEFRCSEGGTAGACASIESSAGVRLVGTWIFDPDSGAMAMMADPSFAYFGWWLNKGTTEGVEAGVFHGVTDGTGRRRAAWCGHCGQLHPLG